MTLVKRERMPFILKRKIPEEFIELEYLETTVGGPVIDTGIIPNLDYTIEVKAVKAIGNALFGSGASNFTFTGSAAGNFAYIGGTKIDVVCSDNKIPHIWKISNRIAYCDDNASIISTGTVAPQFSISLFGRHSAASTYSDEGVHKIYYAKIWDNDGTLVFNGIPAKRKSDSVLGIYDTVSSTLFTNIKTTGTFVAGPNAKLEQAISLFKYKRNELPTGYKRIEYITSANANQAFDTEYIASSDDNFEYKGIKKSGFSLFGVGYSGTYGFTGSGSTHQFRVGSNNNTVTMDTTLHTVKIIDADAYVDGIKTEDTILRVSPAINMVYSIALFGRNRGTFVDDGTAGQTVYYIKFFDKNGDLKFHAIPCINPDGVIGMYDKVAGKFLNRIGSDTTTPFTAGPEIPMEYEVFTACSQTLIEEA